MAERTALAVFTKAPVAGRVKTRLAAAIGEQAALAAHVQLVEDALLRLRLVSGVRRGLWISEAHPRGVAWAEQLDGELYVQHGSHLGRRMAAAMQAHFAAGCDQVVLVGCDCPGVDAAYVQQARQALMVHPVVFGPAEDGGYGLVSLRRDHDHLLPVLFEGISWGSDQVMAESRLGLSKADAGWGELDPIWDVDRPRDWRRYQRLLDS